MRDHKANLTVLANEMRREPTPAESKLWYGYLRKCNPRFLRQKPIGRFIADFYCAKAKLVIEVDGGYHNEQEQQELDELRTEAINEYGINVIRFTNEEVLESFADVCGAIMRAVKTQMENQ